MPSRKHQLTALFDRFAIDLSSVDGVSEDIVRCPLCLRTFGRGAIADPSDDGLSIEHIIPFSLGGKEITLTCRHCNNRTASDVEAHFVRMVRAADWSSGDGSVLGGRFRIGEDALPLKISWTDGKRPVEFKVPGGKHEVLEQYRQRLAKFGPGDTFNFTVKLNYKETNAKRGLIRIAYLTLFHVFGYKYILPVAGEQLRTIIHKGTAEELKPFGIRIGDVQEVKQQPTIRILPVPLEGERAAFLVLLRLQTAQTRYHGILMPGPDLLNDTDVLSKQAGVAKKLSGKRFSL